MYENPLTVSDLNSYIKYILESDEVMQSVYIVGEVSNFKHHTSGHIYFSLKDDKSSLKAVMFANESKNLSFNLENGMKIFAYGYVSCYEAAGQYQLYVYYLSQAGRGEVNEELKRLYGKLSAEGLFDNSHKKSICKYPRKIGVISSKTGAVIHDISSVLKRRFPIAELVLYSVNVQGEKAPSQMIEAINILQEHSDIDTIIIARGGGSTEDLWAFNDEKLIREIFNCKIPIISAVGHDIDYTLCDYVSDIRAATPSVAAEISSGTIDELQNLLKSHKLKIENCLNNHINKLNSNIKLLKNKISTQRIERKIETFKFKLKMCRINIYRSLNNIISKCLNKLKSISQAMNVYNKDYILKKGYVLLTKNDSMLLHVEELKNNDVITMIFYGGKAEFKISNLKMEKNIEK